MISAGAWQGSSGFWVYLKYEDFLRDVSIGLEKAVYRFFKSTGRSGSVKTIGFVWSTTIVKDRVLFPFSWKNLEEQVLPEERTQSCMARDRTIDNDKSITPNKTLGDSPYSDNGLICQSMKSHEINQIIRNRRFRAKTIVQSKWAQNVGENRISKEDLGAR